MPTEQCQRQCHKDARRGECRIVNDPVEADRHEHLNHERAVDIKAIRKICLRVDPRERQPSRGIDHEIAKRPWRNYAQSAAMERHRAESSCTGKSRTRSERERPTQCAGCPTADAPLADVLGTLVELLVVMVILVLLASLVAPKVIGYEAARARNRQRCRSSLSTALELFKLDTGRYLSEREGLSALA